MPELRLNDLAVLARYEARRTLTDVAKRALRRPVPQALPSRVRRSRQKKLIAQQGLAVLEGRPWWFYTALDRGNADPLTNYTLRHLVEQGRKDQPVLVTGCGTGITAFYLADAGFSRVHGIDLIPGCIAVAQRVAKLGAYRDVSFAVDDALDPRLTDRYGVITALHWVFSAWMGNYGNEAADPQRAWDPGFRQSLLTDLLGRYAPHLLPGGILCIELTDAVADYRLPEDHPAGEGSRAIYPVRHSPEQVSRSAAACGLVVEDHQLCITYGHQPRTAYRLRRPA